ncbi:MULTISPECIES: polysaccharide deacetylase family protein [Actinoplanes]|uniref:polysaccharide deacetylase family protein n=1 Tax=Actinoplanes TaxID=1865 RepID=UPI0009FA3E85|nr:MULTISPECIES: polysaccharide deacetylase family protein [Actinoplanes]GLY08395.1 chitooligosaccharide deacetylase [Actinoplanes sp. NBRC 101535]
MRIAATILLAVIVVLGGAAVAAGAFRELVKSRRWHLFGRAVRRVPTTRPVVALTLDDGPYPQHCREILQILEQRRAPATFFLVGRDVDAHPDLVAAIRAGGHELANHGYTHRRLVFMRGAAIRAEVERTDEALRRAGQTGPVLFRPPCCAKLFGLPRLLHRTGRPMITWDVEPETYPAATTDAATIVERALAGARPGSIILLHPMDSANTAARAALPAIVDGLLERGFTLVTVSELLAGAGREHSGQVPRPA